MSKLPAVSEESLQARIYLIRGRKVMLDTDLAKLYGVKTSRLNEAVKRNKRRFPEDFMFCITQEEKSKVIADCDHLQDLKFSPYFPYAFTEQGVAMLSSTLNSKRAIEVNISIMRTFVKLRQMLSAHRGLSQKLDQLEQKVEGHDEEIHSIFEAIRRLMAEPEKPKRRIGFHPGPADSHAKGGAGRRRH